MHLAPRIQRPRSRSGQRAGFVLLAVFFTAVSFGSLSPRHAHAQYMYLDANGDGVHTAADVVTATGTTNFDVWLRTDRNRDGSAAVCTNGGAFTMASYGLFLQADGGRVSWVSSENLLASFGVRFGDQGDDTQYYIGYGNAIFLPPGDYKLCRLAVTVASGSPSIQIVPTGSINPIETTMFGSYCVGLDFDNTLKLGSDWFDVDGLAFSSSGGSSNAPAIAGPAQLSVATGETAFADFSATDVDGDHLTIALRNSPGFQALTPMGDSPGAVSARVQAAPRRQDVGSYSASLDVTDGVHTSSAPLATLVTLGPNHPPTIAPIPAVRMAAGTVSVTPLGATDWDGDAATFELADGPPFAQVATLHAGIAASTGRLTLRPTKDDAGSYTATIRVTTLDGVVTAPCRIDVVAPQAAPSPSVRTFPKYTTATASADFNEDGTPDIARVGEVFTTDVEALLGDGTGDLHSSWRYSLPSGYVDVVTADWNQDGHADLAVGSYNGPPLQIFWGRGDGTFSNPVVYADVVGVSELRAADLNGDGVQDLVASSTTPSLYVLHGVAGGAPVRFQTIDMGSLNPSVAIGDYDLDGRLDLAVGTLADRSLNILRGQPDGRFAPGTVVGTDGAPYGLAPLDWNEDGIPDLVATRSYADGALLLLRGRGDGSFDVTTGSGSFLLSFETAVTDWNGDGHADVIPAATQSYAGLRILLGSGTGTFDLTTIPGIYWFGWNDICPDLNRDGRPDLVWGDALTTILNTSSAGATLPARAFVAPSSNRSIPINLSAAPIWIRIEPVDGAFEAQDVDPTSVFLASPGTGLVQEIAATSGKSQTLGDSDKNGVAEYPACFAMADLAYLFARLNGKQEIQVSVQGRLFDGRRFGATATLTIVPTGIVKQAPRIDPNPLNPEGVLSFSTETPGAVTIRVFDVSGRLARTVWNGRSTAPGLQEARIDGKDDGGRALRSGVYFYRIEGPGLSETGRFTILK